MSIEQMKASIAIFEKYVDESQLVFHAEHDTLHGPNFDDMEGLTEEDRQVLVDLGWHEGDCDSWERNCSC